jgi:DNA sulfur modification protein DndC
MLSKLIVAVEKNKHFTRGNKVSKAFDKIINEGWIHYEAIKKAKEDINHE